MVAILPITMLRSIVQAAMVGLRRFKSIAVVRVTEGFAGALVPLLLAHFVTTELSILLLSIVAIKAITLLVLWGFYAKAATGFVVRLPRSSIAKSLFRFGAWATVSSIITPSFVTIDRFVIARVVGMEAIPSYSVPQSVAQHISIVPRAFSNVLFPRFSDTSDPMRASALAVRAIEATNFLMAPICVVALIAVEPFLYFWVGPEFAEDSKVVAGIFIAGAWVVGLGRIPGAYLYGQGLPDKMAKVHVAELLPFVVVVYFMTRCFGIAGSASAVLLRGIVETLLLARCCGLASAILRLGVAPLLLIVASALIGLLMPMESLLRWLLASCSAVATLVWFVLGAPKELGEHIVRYAPFLKVIPFRGGAPKESL
jgi:O-antigen/teichoic acid export membrane protein